MNDVMLREEKERRREFNISNRPTARDDQQVVAGKTADSEKKLALSSPAQQFRTRLFPSRSQAATPVNSRIAICNGCNPEGSGRRTFETHESINTYSIYVRFSLGYFVDRKILPDLSPPQP